MTMEALVIILAEILFACLAPAFALIGALFAAILEALALALSGLLGSPAKTPRKERREPSRATAPSEPRKPLVSRRFLHWSAGILGGAAVLGVAASVVFMDPLLRSVLNSAGERAGISIDYRESSGALLLGRVTLDDVAMTRQSDAGLAFDLEVERIEADVALFSLLRGEPVITHAGVSGVTGYVTPPERETDAGSGEKDRLRERRPFRADRVQVAAVDLEIRPRQTPSYELTIETAEVAPLRSQLAMFDLLFRSNLDATVAGQPIFVSTREISEKGRETIWRFEEVEADALKLILPKAPLTWMTDGRLTARVEDSWDLSDDFIAMDWQIGFDGIDIAPPEGAGSVEALLANGLAKAVERQGGSADFAYRLELGPEEVATLRSGDLSAFWDTVLSGFVKQKATSAPEEPETDEASGGRIRDALNAIGAKIRGEAGDE